MPLYFVDLHDDTRLFSDSSGTQATDDRAARSIGQKALMEAARDYIPDDVTHFSLSMTIRRQDVPDLIALRVNFAADGN